MDGRALQGGLERGGELLDGAVVGGVGDIEFAVCLLWRETRDGLERAGRGCGSSGDVHRLLDCGEDYADQKEFKDLAVNKDSADAYFNEDLAKEYRDKAKADLAELDRMAKALETCSRFGIRSISECDARIKMVEKHIEGGNGSEAERKSLEALREARDFTAANGLLPRTSAKSKNAKTKADASHGTGKKKTVEKHKHTRREAQRGNREKGER